MKSLQLILLSSFLCLITSCDLPKHYFSAAPKCISDTVNDLTEENQKQFVLQLKNKSPKDYRYFFKTFERIGNSTYMITNFRNEKECFEIKMLIEQSGKLAGMITTNGKSYPKELYDLKWEIKEFQGVETLTYIDMHRIID